MPTDRTITPTHGSHNTGYRVERHGPNESVPVHAGTDAVAATRAATSIAPMALPGDFILTHSPGLYGELIRFGETLRYWGKDKVFAHWSHAAIFVNDTGDIIEALGGGVQLDRGPPGFETRWAAAVENFKPFGSKRVIRSTTRPATPLLPADSAYRVLGVNFERRKSMSSPTP